MFNAGRRGAAGWMWAVLIASTALGCRVNQDDLRRWERTQNGPDKLVAVLTHDKYENELRTDAAWSLIEMKKRGGQAIGLTRLLEELLKLPKAERDTILAGLWKRMQPKVSLPLEAAGDGKMADPSVVYKDATFALFTEDRLDLDPKIRAEMTAALSDWATGRDGEPIDRRLTTFEMRLDNAAQTYGVEQVIRRLGLPATKRLPPMLTAPAAIKSQRLDVMARVVADVKPATNDAAAQAQYQAAREELSRNFAQILKASLANGYTDAVRPEIEEILKRSPGGQAIVANPDQMRQYLDKVRDERLSYLFAVAKVVGRKPVVETLLSVGSDETNKQAQQRALALAALEGNVDTSSDQHLKSLLAIIRGTAPDEVKHGALLRINAYPPDVATKTFYELFDSSNWRVRYDGAMSVLALMAKVGDKTKTTPKEFLARLPAKDNTPAGLGEPSSYGQQLAQLPPALGAKEAIDAALKGPNLLAQLTALGFYLSTGTPADLAVVSKLENDKSPVPRCKPEDECGWDKPGCPIPKPGAKPDDAPEWKSIATVAEYVQFCVKPQIELRAKAHAEPPTK